MTMNENHSENRMNKRVETNEEIIMAYRNQNLGVTALVLPLEGEPYEIQLPQNIRSKQELQEYLVKLKVFHCGFDEQDDEIELGFYWRSILTDYKKTPRACIVFRFSKGKQLPQNDLCQKWRPDPWKKTYGPIVLLRIQQGNTQFKIESYSFADFQKQSRYDKSQAGEMSQKKNPKGMDWKRENDKEFDLEGKIENDSSDSPPDNLWTKLVDLVNFQYQVKQLYEIAMPERWDYVEEPCNFVHPVLFHYLFNISLKAINYHKEGYLTRCKHDSFKFAVDIGLEHRETGEKLYSIMEKVEKNDEVKLLIRNFVTWYEAVTMHNFAMSEIPKPVRFASRKELAIDDTKDIDFSRLLTLFDGRKDILPQRLQNMTKRERALLCAGLEEEARKKGFQEMIPGLFNDNQALKVEWLLPLRCMSDDFVDCVVALKVEKGKYVATQLLKKDWAYSLARCLVDNAQQLLPWIL